MSGLIQTLMYHCPDCGHRFSKPAYWTVEDQYGSLKKVPYCPNCVSQNIEQLRYGD
jgi:predicted RNA-binding Zn-ribbon protein involved in translation (DUF1610 family)